MTDDLAGAGEAMRRWRHVIRAFKVWTGKGFLRHEVMRKTMKILRAGGIGVLED